MASEGWWTGPANAVDRLIVLGVDAIEISWRLDVPVWFVRERFAEHHAQRHVVHDTERVAA